MPFRDVSMLESWLDDFRGLGYRLTETIRVLAQDPDEGRDTGLVAASLESVPTVLYLQPVAPGAAEWEITFEPRDQPASVGAASVLALANELSVLSALCTFLQARSAEYIRAHNL